MTAVVRRETREKGNEDMKRKDKIPCVFKKKKKKLKGNILCCCSLRILHQRMEFCIEIERLKGWKKSKIKQQQNKTKKKKKIYSSAFLLCAKCAKRGSTNAKSRTGLPGLCFSSLSLTPLALGGSCSRALYGPHTRTRTVKDCMA